ncbi:PREDICTED: EG45-like domain containing protein [Nelumbo nucifera]|uniref:EG45-like domain containing protein n=1 Tax=Nelumbo nucifera TaxID=4432 RepID=A0A1U7ZK60_NELNU|nr:PREDICTED: EG45-like domain containing protein [Nelumbo nucifera]
MLFTQITRMRSIIAIIIVAWLCVDILLIKGDVGTATSYDPPYLPTKCSGYDQNQFPEGGLFAAASNGIWDNGAACGRRYRIRCISGLKRPCKDGSIVVEVVDICRNNPCPATLVLSNTAFNCISNIPSAKVNVEYAQI